MVVESSGIAMNAADGEADRKPSKMKSHSCEKHPNELERLYCFDCKTTICVLCFVKNHQSHKCSDVDEVADEFLRRLKADLDLLAGVETQLEDFKMKVEIEKDKAIEQSRTVNEMIVKRGDEIKSLVDAHVKALHDQVSSTTDDRRHDLHDACEDVDHQLATIESLKTYCEELKDKGTVREVVAAADDVHESVQTRISHVARGGLRLTELTFIESDLKNRYSGISGAIVNNLVGSVEMRTNNGRSSVQQGQPAKGISVQQQIPYGQTFGAVQYDYTGMGYVNARSATISRPSYIDMSGYGNQSTGTNYVTPQAYAAPHVPSAMRTRPSTAYRSLLSQSTDHQTSSYDVRARKPFFQTYPYQSSCAISTPTMMTMQPQTAHVQGASTSTSTQESKTKKQPRTAADVVTVASTSPFKHIDAAGIYDVKPAFRYMPYTAMSYSPGSSTSYLNSVPDWIVSPLPTTPGQPTSDNCDGHTATAVPALSDSSTDNAAISNEVHWAAVSSPCRTVESAAVRPFESEDKHRSATESCLSTKVFSSLSGVPTSLIGLPLYFAAQAASSTSSFAVADAVILADDAISPGAGMTGAVETSSPPSHGLPTNASDVIASKPVNQPDEVHGLQLGEDHTSDAKTRATEKYKLPEPSTPSRADGGGRRRYDRDFLLRLQDATASKHRPSTLLDNLPEIFLAQPIGTSHCGVVTFVPGYVIPLSFPVVDAVDPTLARSSSSKRVHNKTEQKKTPKPKS